jgi:hypothetical protein
VGMATLGGVVDAWHDRWARGCSRPSRPSVPDYAIGGGRRRPHAPWWVRDGPPTARPRGPARTHTPVARPPEPRCPDHRAHVAGPPPPTAWARRAFPPERRGGRAATNSASPREPHVLVALRHRAAARRPAGGRAASSRRPLTPTARPPSNVARTRRNGLPTTLRGRFRSHAAHCAATTSTVVSLSSKLRATRNSATSAAKPWPFCRAQGHTCTSRSAATSSRSWRGSSIA